MLASLLKVSCFENEGQESFFLSYIQPIPICIHTCVDILVPTHICIIALKYVHP